MTMSNRVALLQEGRLLQVGTPDDLYTNPDNLNVARFIGSPETNILPAQAVPGGFDVGDVFIPHVHDLAPLRDLFITVRPEALIIGGATGHGDKQMISLPVTQQGQEDLGGEIILRASLNSLPDMEIRARLQKSTGGITADFRHLPKDMSMMFPASVMCLFDADGQRIRKTATPVAALNKRRELVQ
jgi:multiple sugar transport system ATP-binding protein